MGPHELQATLLEAISCNFCVCFLLLNGPQVLQELSTLWPLLVPNGPPEWHDMLSEGHPLQSRVAVCGAEWAAGVAGDASDRSSQFCGCRMGRRSLQLGKRFCRPSPASPVAALCAGWAG